MPDMKGGCLCGAVRYITNVAPEFVALCHCIDCQKHTGSAFAIGIRLPKTALHLQGTIKTFSSLGDSGNPILRYFCPECGSSIYDEPTARPGKINLNAGTLDDPSLVVPTLEIWCDSALPWVQLAGMQRFARGIAAVNAPSKG
jgi:hypothetical protein